ncbi:tetratricopeptide repeat protein [Thermodesulfobacteriota bacterium]
MGFFDKFKEDKNESDLPEDIEKTLGKLYHGEEVRKLVNKAISYRNLGQYDKAIGIIKEVIKNHPNYLPATTVLGNTLTMKGDFVEAENYFKKVLSEYSEKEEFNLMETYANLGVIRWRKYNDIKGALEYYDLALNEVNTGPVYYPEFGLYGEISENSYEYAKSNIYKDLCSLYFEIEKYDLAKKYAAKRLKIVSDCLVASRVFGSCLMFEHTANNHIIECIIDNIEPKELMVASKCFKNCFEENPEDYYALFGLCVCHTCYALWGAHNEYNLEEISERNKEYASKLGSLAEESDTAQKLYDQYIHSIKTLNELLFVQMTSSIN